MLKSGGRMLVTSCNPQSGEKAEGGLCLHAEKIEEKLIFLLS